VQRLGRGARYVERSIEHVFDEFGLHPHEFYVLGVLRRSGEPHRMSPTHLARTLLLTAASVTHRVDRLEKAGLVRRTPDPADRRGIFVELTPEGLGLVDRAIEAHAAAEEYAVSGLTTGEQKQLARILRKLLLTFGDTPPAPRS
jgi:DNA-binding MarR family transcriptional regulator